LPTFSIRVKLESRKSSRRRTAASCSPGRTWL